MITRQEDLFDDDDLDDEIDPAIAGALGSGQDENIGSDVDNLSEADDQEEDDQVEDQDIDSDGNEPIFIKSTPRSSHNRRHVIKKTPKQLEAYARRLETEARIAKAKREIAGDADEGKTFPAKIVKLSQRFAGVDPEDINNIYINKFGPWDLIRLRAGGRALLDNDTNTLRAVGSESWPVPARVRCPITKAIQRSGPSVSYSTLLFTSRSLTVSITRSQLR